MKDIRKYGKHDENILYDPKNEPREICPKSLKK